MDPRRARVAEGRNRVAQRWSRHSRSPQFDQALEGTGPPSPAVVPPHWNEAVSDPNDPTALAARSESLRQAWRSPVNDRITWLTDRCAGRSVLDIGCVAHSTDRMNDPSWLHGRLATVAETCLGVDVIGPAVAEMNARGFHAIKHDLGTGVGPLSSEGPFDVIVAGEIIEHVGDVSLLFTAASALLASDGELIITTPNPYALDRFLAGRCGIVWENVDHVSYAFPSGIAELAERHHLQLLEAMTVQGATPSVRVDRPGTSLRRLKRRVTGSHWKTVGFTTTGAREVRPPMSAVRAWLVSRLVGGDRRLLGETFVYVVGRHPGDEVDAPSSDV